MRSSNRSSSFERVEVDERDDLDMESNSSEPRDNKNKGLSNSLKQKNSNSIQEQDPLKKFSNSSGEGELAKPFNQAMKQLSANDKQIKKFSTPLNDGSSNYEDFA